MTFQCTILHYYHYLKILYSKLSYNHQYYKFLHNYNTDITKYINCPIHKFSNFTKIHKLTNFIKNKMNFLAEYHYIKAYHGLVKTKRFIVSNSSFEFMDGLYFKMYIASKILRLTVLLSTFKISNSKSALVFL